MGGGYMGTAGFCLFSIVLIWKECARINDVAWTLENKRLLEIVKSNHWVSCSPRDVVCRGGWRELSLL